MGDDHDRPPRHCLACNHPVLACMVGVQRVWLNPDPQPEPETGMIAYNPATSGGRIITAFDLDQVRHWQRAGRVTVHTIHERTCDPQPVLQGWTGA